MVIRDARYYQNRINLLINRGKENGNIIKKLQRKIKLIKRNG